VQTGLVIDATENDGWSPEQVTEDELNALFQSKVVPFVPCEGADGTVSAEWRVDVPLVVIDTDYAPLTGGRSCPLSNELSNERAAMRRDSVHLVARGRRERPAQRHPRPPAATGWTGNK
jgi:hypothetical protein